MDGLLMMVVGVSAEAALSGVGWKEGGSGMAPEGGSEVLTGDVVVLCRSKRKWMLGRWWCFGFSKK